MPLIETQPDALSEVYARSLRELAFSKGGVDKVRLVLDELQGVLALARDNPRFGEFLSSRIISVKDKKKSITSALRGKSDDLTLHFLLAVADNERLAKLPGIVGSLAEMVDAVDGRVEVSVTTPAPINDSEIASLRERIAAKMPGNTPVIKAFVDPNMIGGIRLQVGDKLFDASVQTKLRQLRDQLALNGLPAVRAAMGRIIQA